MNKNLNAFCSEKLLQYLIKPNTDHKGRFNDLPQLDLLFPFSESFVCMKNAFIIWLCLSTLIADIELAAGH